MKKTLFVLFGWMMLTFASAQEYDFLNEEEPGYVERGAMTFGILNGGGGILGADLEIMLSSRIGVQAGLGLYSYGAGINFHLEPGIRSSMINLGYWHQGIGDSHTQTLIGPSYVYRGRKIFTSQIGLGFLIEEGPAWPSDKKHLPVMLVYSLGVYIPCLKTPVR